MAVYELRTYTLYTGKMAEAIGHYETLGWPVLEKYQDKLIGYFTSDTGTLHQLVHLWKFDDDVDRRVHWKTLLSDPDFIKFGEKFRPLVITQANQLLLAAPWGPHP